MSFGREIRPSGGGGARGYRKSRSQDWVLPAHPGVRKAAAEPDTSQIRRVRDVRDAEARAGQARGAAARVARDYAAGSQGRDAVLLLAGGAGVPGERGA